MTCLKVSYCHMTYLSQLLSHDMPESQSLSHDIPQTVTVTWHTLKSVIVTLHTFKFVIFTWHTLKSVIVKWHTSVSYCHKTYLSQLLPHDIPQSVTVTWHTSVNYCHRTYLKVSYRHMTYNVGYKIAPDFYFVLAMDVIVCTAVVGNVLRTSVCTSPTVLEAEVLWSWLKFVMMVARNIECRKIERWCSWSYRSAIFATAKLWSRLSTWQCKMSRGWSLARLS